MIIFQKYMDRRFYDKHIVILSKGYRINNNGVKLYFHWRGTSYEGYFKIINYGHPLMPASFLLVAEAVNSNENDVRVEEEEAPKPQVDDDDARIGCG